MDLGRQRSHRTPVDGARSKPDVPGIGNLARQCAKRRRPRGCVDRTFPGWRVLPDGTYAVQSRGLGAKRQLQRQRDRYGDHGAETRTNHRWQTLARWRGLRGYLDASWFRRDKGGCTAEGLACDCRIRQGFCCVAANKRRRPCTRAVWREWEACRIAGIAWRRV